MGTWLDEIMVGCDHGGMVPWLDGAMVDWGHGVMVPRLDGAMVGWNHGWMGQGLEGIMVGMLFPPKLAHLWPASYIAIYSFHPNKDSACSVCEYVDIFSKRRFV